MQRQACEPCAKRKVRCDRTEPCSNCKRRKQDHCSYPESTPGDRIKQLEGLVRALGGDPDSNVAIDGRHRTTAAASPASTIQSLRAGSVQATPNDSRSKDPVILEEDGQQYYLESRIWLTHGHLVSGGRGVNAKNPLLLKSAPHALSSIISICQAPVQIVATLLHESNQTILRAFKQRVYPFTRIVFDWELDRLESVTALASDVTQLDDAQAALVASMCLGGIVCLTDLECREKLQRSRTSLLAESQSVCEAALSKTNILCMKNVTSLKAMAIYIMTGLDRLSTQSLWTLLGLAIRNGERLGVHRDGTLLGLSPVETEDRRRLWWQLQYLDLILAIRVGATPLTLMADWDVKLPLNIEDGDLLIDANSFPEERKGLTNMSYCLFTYYVLDQQRRYHADKGQFELSWSTNQTVPIETKRDFIDELENGLNKVFVQYCDPIKPLHVLLQTMTRALTCVFRQRILLRMSENSSDMMQEHHGSLLVASMKLLEYAIALHSNPLLKDFRWWTANGFPWPAFMVVLIEASHESDADKCRRVWALLADLFTANTSLFELTDDRRRLHAAELIVAAWRTCLSKGTVGPSSSKPDFVSKLERLLAEVRAEPAPTLDSTATREVEQENLAELEDAPNFSADLDINGVFELDFQDIDWSFWNSID